MTPERWRQITDVFHAALARDTAARRAFLDEACASDRALRDEVDAMLASHGGAGQFGEQPVRLSTIEVRRLQPGAVVGPYRIDGLIGAGGMGEVYRAHDSRIGREVAIKVLPADYAADSERLRRFEQEARLVGSLNHPNLVTLHDVGTADGQPYLVTELLDGETLRDRISRGPTPPPRACAMAADVARGLAAAHAKGIVHRDLKPENVMVTRDGRVKILDFGIAKLRAPEAGPDGRTLTTPLHTAPDTVLGTAGYMAPEQVRGLPADERADLFALGAILFELLTGRRAFDRDSRVETLNAILHDDPPALTNTAAAIPSVVERIVRRCVEKDPDARFQSARDLAFALETTSDRSATDPMSPALPGRRRVIGTRAAAAVAVIALAVAGWTGWKFAASRESPAARPVTRFVIQPPPAATMAPAGFDISADGSQVVYAGGQPRRRFIRRFDQFDGVPVPGTEGALSPFFSPDGQWVGFAAGGKLQKVNLRAAAAPVVLCSAAGARDFSWAIDDTIFFKPVAVAGKQNNGVRRVSAEGGEPSEITTVSGNPPEVDHHSPELLPDGQTLLFTIHQREDRFKVATQSLRSGERKVIVDSGFDAQYSPSGHIVFARGSAILAAPFDLSRLEVTGAPVTLVEHVATSSRDGVGGFRLSKNGSLAYEPERSLAGRVLTWVDRTGRETPLPIAPRAFRTPRVSPDGKTLAFAVADGDRHDIWTYDLAADKLTRVTSEGDNQAPLWTPDGRRLSYASIRDDGPHLMWQPSDGSGQPESLLSSRNLLWPNAWTTDNRALVYVEQPPTDEPRIFVLRLDEGRYPQPLVQGDGRHPSLSPDGRWLAYTSQKTGRNEVYVESFPISTLRQQVTVDGGREVKWRRDGREIFYRAGPRVFVVPVDTTHTFSAGRPMPLFERAYVVDFANGLDYDVAPDGRFLMIKPSDEEQAPPRLNVVLNWADELARRVPTSFTRR